MSEWWTNSDKGIVEKELVQAILFEYDFYIEENCEALSYGICEWKNFEPHTKALDMGYSYDFTSEFEAMPGITLSFFDDLAPLDKTDFGPKYQFSGYLELPGIDNLLKSYIFSGLLAIHEAFTELDESKLFENINYEKGFMFVIGEHDTGEVYPLLIKE